MEKEEFMELARNQPVVAFEELWDRLEAAEEAIAALTIEPEEPATEEPA